MINFLLFMPSIFFYKIILASKKIKIRVADTYLLTYLLTFIFFDGINEGSGKYSHVFYVILWPLFFLLGCLFANKTNLKLRKNINPVLVKTIIIMLSIYFFIFAAINIKTLVNIDLSLYDEIRQNTEVSYFEYMFSKSLVFLVFLYIFFMSKVKLLKVIYFIALLSIASATLQKSLMLYSLMSLLIFKYTYKNIQISYIKVIYILILSIFIATMLSWFIYGSDILITLNAVMRRIFWLPADLSFQTLKMIDENNYLFLGGASLKTLFDFFNLPSIYLGEATYIYYFGYIQKAASANSPMLTALYADFNYFALIFSFLFGFLLRVIDKIHINSKKTILSVSAYSTLVICSLKFNITNFGTAFVSEGFLVTLIIFIIAIKTKISNSTISN